MGIRKLIRNIKFLINIDLEKKYSHDLESTHSNINLMLDNVVYELPNHLEAITKPKICDLEKTINALIYSKSSLCRFGDGELAIINGESIPFQVYDQMLASRLKEILLSQNNNIFIGINYFYFYANLTYIHDFVKNFLRTNGVFLRKKLLPFLLSEKQYYSTEITCAYLTYREYNFDCYYKKLRLVWDKKDVTIICGDRILQNINFNIFENANNIEYKFEKTVNAFSDYDQILARALEIDKDRLVICILGPTAKVLAYDLAIQGYRALDMGHIIKDYDAYKKEMIRTKESIGTFFAPD